jgi:hypothetical protein
VTELENKEADLSLISQPYQETSVLVVLVSAGGLNCGKDGN